MKSHNNDFYNYKIEMYIGNSNVLCFSAYLALDEDDTPNYIINNVPNFKKDKLSIELFDDIIYGRIEKTYVDEDLIPYPITINEENAIKNIDKYISLQQEGYFSSKVDLQILTEVDVIGFRFQGPSYNLKYSISSKAANKFDEISNKLIKVIDNYSNSKTFYRANNIAASTMIRFTNEEIGYSLENVISKLSKDINSKSIDRKYIKEDSNGELYKNILKNLKDVALIKDLDVFQIYVNDKPYPIRDFDYLLEATSQMYGTKITGVGVKKGIAYIEDGKIVSITLDLIKENGKDLDNKKTFQLHIPTINIKMTQDAKNVPIYDERTLIKFEGIMLSDQTAECKDLLTITTNPK